MKSNERAELDRLMASFKGTIKRCPPATPKAVKKIKRKARAASDGRLETAEATMRIESPPPEEAKDATKGGSGADLGGMTRFKEADYDGARGPRDHARRAFHMPKDYRSRGYIEMMVNAAVKDDVYEDFTGGLGKFDPYEREREQRFRSAAKKGTTCGACGNALDSKEPVWRVRRKYDGTKFEIEWDHGGGVLEADDVVAPICRPCWDKDHQSSRVAQTGPCSACGRTVHLTAKALPAWLSHGKRIYCCEDCTRRPAIKRPAFKKTCEQCGKPFAPKRLDARFCGAACRVKASRKNKSS